MKEFTGNVFNATFSAASAPKADATTAFAKELIVPFWLVRSTGDKDRANMHRSTLVCKMSIAAGKEEGVCDPVPVPILQNTKVLQEGDELLVYDSGLVTPKFSLEPQVQPTQKMAAPPKRLHQPPKKANATKGN